MLFNIVYIIKPDAEIHLAGTTYWHDVNAGRRLYLDRLLERITKDPEAAQHGYYFDVVSLHIYFRSETVYDIVRKTRALLDQYGLSDKHIWLNETNAGPTDDPLWPVVRPQYQIDLAQQAAFLVQAAALGLAAGVERMAVYKFYDWNLPPGAESFGLLRPDQSRRPAFDSWAMVIRELNGVKSATLAQSDRVDAIRLSRTDGSQMVALWARKADVVQVQISATSTSATMIDQYGHQMAIEPVNHQYAISLEGARCNKTDGCAVGGNVELLMLPSGDMTIQEITSSGTIEIGRAHV